MTPQPAPHAPADLLGGHTRTHPPASELPRELHRLMTGHGKAAAIWVMIGGLLLRRRRHSRVPDPCHFTAHMRRDIGLPPVQPPVIRYHELR